MGLPPQTLPSAYPQIDGIMADGINGRPLRSSRSTGSVTLQNSARRSFLARALYSERQGAGNYTGRSKGSVSNDGNAMSGRTGREKGSSTARSQGHFLRNDKLIAYTPYYSQPDISPRNKKVVLQTTRPGLSQYPSQMDATRHFPQREQVLNSTRSTSRISGIYLAELRRKKVVEKELEDNRLSMLKLIEERKLQLRRQINATDRALRVKEQLKTLTTAEGSALVAKIKNRKISEKVIPVSRFNKYGYRSHRDSSHMFNGIGFCDSINYTSSYNQNHGNHDQKTSRQKLFLQELKNRHPLKEAEFTKFASKAIMANVDLTTVGHGLVQPPRGTIRRNR